MANEKFTPGPWVVDSKYKLTVRPTGKSSDPRYPGPAVIGNAAITELHREYGEFGNGNIAHMESQFHAPHAFITWEQAVANAKLISTAPDFYAAALELFERHDQEARGNGFNQCGCEDCTPFRLIVAKATSSEGEREGKGL